MDSKIVETLKVMCDDDNIQDKKILLLAELVEGKFDAIGKTQEELKAQLRVTDQKLDRLIDLLEVYKKDTHECPVYRNKENYEKISFYVKNPKSTLLILIGIVALLSGFLGSELTALMKSFFNL